MSEFNCSSCGSKEFTSKNGKRVCAYCGTMFVGEGGETTIALNEDVERLLKMCRANPKKASMYANLVLDIDPSNAEALKYL